MMKGLKISVACCFLAAMLLLVPGCAGGKNKNVPADGSWRPGAPVNLIVCYTAGGGTDVLARTIAKYIDLDGQSMYVTNIEGGSGNIGAMEAYHADNDGLTLLLHYSESCAVNYLTGSLPENLNEDMVYAASLAEDANVLSVAKDSPYQTLEDVIAAAEKSPGDLTIAAIGGSSTEAFVTDALSKAGVDITYVPYDSAAKSRTAVMGGHEDMLWSQYADIMSYVESGELRVLGVTSEERLSALPDVPTFREKGIDTVTAFSRCVMLPPGTDEAIARYYDAKLKEVFDNPEFQKIARETLGFELQYTGYDDMKEKARETARWAEDIMTLLNGR